MIIAMRTSIAGEGSTEPNLYFACGKMQTDPDSPPIKKTTFEVNVIKLESEPKL